MYSEKGGVGKSALSAGLVAAARRRKRPVVAGDLDPRATFSAELGIAADSPPAFTMNDLLALDPQGDTGLAADAMVPAGEAWSGVQVIAAERALANRETDNVAVGLEFRLRMALKGVIPEDGVAVLDLPPRAGGKLVTSALVAATDVVIPATLDEDGRIGAAEALSTIRLVQDLGMNPNLRVVGIVPSIVPGGRSTLKDAIGKHLADTYGSLYRDDLAIPRHSVRQQTRFACVPITDASGREAQALTDAYDRILMAGVAQ
ncbi:ParA family protein [Streptomyces genisteinicus]|uniref:ParA family protein n=1 Tax=Streptomyces genisteinicus TaxID=2768068 RepID=A0A7H0I5B1_9ACTN|nr:ParA family protein [Streptomyces genisteinicus]QNP67977.1 ParA family protein [Streptomyces genisteinicus]